MHRFYLPPEQCRGTEIHLGGREAFHGLRVLRLRRAEPVVVLDGAGTELACQVLEAGSNRIRLQVIQRRAVPPLPFSVTLLQAVPKGKLIESIIQKATELGVSRIVPLLSERTALRLSPADAERKLDKWQQVAVEAIKQCGSAWLPRIEAPVAPPHFLQRAEKFDLSLVASLQPNARHARGHFANFEQQHGRAPRSVCIWVGPEGDFTTAEIEAIQAAGALPITLGRLVLRSETAAVYCLSILNYELQAPRSHPPA